MLNLLVFLAKILWDKIARPRFSQRGLFYPLDKCFPAEPLIHRTLLPGKIYSVKKIIKNSLEITEKLHFFYFYFIFFVQNDVISCDIHARWLARTGKLLSNMRYKIPPTRGPHRAIIPVRKILFSLFIHRTLHPGKIYPVTKSDLFYLHIFIRI